MLFQVKNTPKLACREKSSICPFDSPLFQLLYDVFLLVLDLTGLSLVVVLSAQDGLVSGLRNGVLFGSSLLFSVRVWTQWLHSGLDDAVADLVLSNGFKMTSSGRRCCCPHPALLTAPCSCGRRRSCSRPCSLLSRLQNEASP